MRLRGAAVIHSPKLDDDILAKALDQLTAERRRQEKHPFARRHFVRFSRDDYPVIRLARSLTSPSRTGTMDGLGRTASSFTLATTRTEAELRPYLLPSLAAAAVCLSAAAAAPDRPAAHTRPARQGKSKGKRRRRRRRGALQLLSGRARVGQPAGSVGVSLRI